MMSALCSVTSTLSRWSHIVIVHVTVAVAICMVFPQVFINVAVAQSGTYPSAVREHEHGNTDTTITVDSTMATTTFVSPTLACLRARHPSMSVILPGDEHYSTSSFGENVRFAHTAHPDAIVNVTSVSDVQAAVICAGAHGVEVNVMNGGHSFDGLSMTNGILLNLDSFHRLLDVNHTAHTMKVEAGVRLARLSGLAVREFSSSTSAYAVGGGTCPTVGITGHTVCGGYGKFGRATGLASDQVESFDVVLASGAHVVANSTHYEDLFYALRGGCSSSFGIIVAITYRLHLIPSNVITTVDIPIITENVPEYASWWQSFAPYAPNELSLVMHWERDGISTRGAFIGSKSEAMSLLEPHLKSWLGHEDIAASFHQGTLLDAMMSIHELSSLDEMLETVSLDAHRQRRYKGTSLMGMNALDLDAWHDIEQFFHAGDFNGFLEFKAYGGTSPIGEHTDDRSPLVRGQLFEAHFDIGTILPEESISNEELIEEGQFSYALLRDLFPRAANHTCPQRSYPGYIDVDLGRAAPDMYFGSKNSARLASIRAKYDPKNILKTYVTDFLYPKVQDFDSAQRTDSCLI